MLINLIALRKNAGTVGIEFAGTHVRVLAAVGNGDRVTTLAHSRAHAGGDPGTREHWEHETSQVLTNFVKANRLQGSPVAMSVPNDKVVVRYMQLPDLPAKALRQAVAVELGTSIHLPFEDPQYDVIPVPCINPGQLQPGYRTMCLIASPRDEVKRMVSIAQAAGLHPVSIDISPLAVMRGTGVEALDADGLTCLIQVSNTDIALSIFVGGAMYFFRSVEVSVTSGDAATGASWVNDVAYEFERVVNFFNYNLSGSERPVDRVLIHALDCDGTSLTRALSSRVGREMTLVSPGSAIHCERAEWLVAAGLALKGREKR